MKLLFKFIIGVLAAIGASVIAGEVYVMAYVFFHGGIKSNYSEDYGLAFDIVMIWIAVFVAIGIVYILRLKKRF